MNAPDKPGYWWCFGSPHNNGKPCRMIVLVENSEKYWEFCQDYAYDLDTHYTRRNLTDWEFIADAPCLTIGE